MPPDDTHSPVRDMPVRRAAGREGENMIKIEVTPALKDALEHASSSGTPQVALYKDRPIVILSYDEYERLSDEQKEQAG